MNKNITHMPIEQALDAITGAAIQGYRAGAGPSLNTLLSAALTAMASTTTTTETTVEEVKPEAPVADELQPPEPPVTDDKLAETLRGLHPDFVEAVGKNISIMLRTTAALTLAAGEIGDLSELPALAERDPAAARAKLDLLGRVAVTATVTKPLSEGDFADAASQLYADLYMSGLIPGDLRPLDLPSEDEAKAILGLTPPAPAPTTDDAPTHSNS